MERSVDSGRLTVDGGRGLACEDELSSTVGLGQLAVGVGHCALEFGVL